jgi:Sister chromatid cohesion protein Dcc1
MLYFQFTYEELLEAVQASEDELSQGLCHLNACIIDGTVSS